MSVIHRDIYLTRHQRIQPIDIVRGSQVGIELQLMDYDFPAGASAKAYARGRHAPDTYVADCTISGKTVSFTPPDGFFIPGPNRLQIEINGVIIPFSIDVNCESRISDAGDPATPEQVTPLAERAEMAATEAEQSKETVEAIQTELEADYPLVPQLRQELADVDSRLSESIVEISSITGIAVSYLDDYYINYKGERIKNTTSKLAIVSVENLVGQTIKLFNKFFDYSGYVFVKADDSRFGARYWHPAQEDYELLEINIPDGAVSLEVSILKKNADNFKVSYFDAERYTLDMAKISNAMRSKAEIEVVNGKLDKETFGDVASFVESENLFNATPDMPTKSFYASSNGKLTLKADDSFTAAIIPVDELVTYTASIVDYVVYFVADDMETILSFNNPSASTIYSFTFTTPEYTRYVALSWKHERVSVNDFMLVKGLELPTEYKPYTGSYWEINKNVVIRKNEYTVAIDGSGDYTSLTECLLALEGDESEKTIYIKSGTYDIFEEIGGEEFCRTIQSGINWKQCSVMVPHNTSIIGLGQVTLEFKPTLAQIGRTAGNLLSPINVPYSCHIENINIDSYNCRYAIHSDGNETYKQVKQTFKNVRINHQYRDTGLVVGFGCGFRKNTIFNFYNCTFKAFLPISFHNNGSDAIDNSQIIFNNCVFKSTYPNDYPVLRLGNVNYNQVHVNVDINSCYLNSNIKIINETTELERPNAFDITMMNCSDVTFEVIPTVNIYTPTIYSL